MYEKFAKNKTKISRQNLSSPLVFTETPKEPIDTFVYPTRNCAITISDELSSPKPAQS